ncbi:hypothetical protein NBRC110019_06330 [Neptunitalea chrysea]|uniref:Uncharacterized protein n=1 Tax=Neptunitalea chrysea TaxID=1647581 RepID=A0A9W6B383_9FLAO|nr:hypothetical protein [Neptunitalea chrysea]GLB51594.1 hypothetical protein NBRC110019_06330 [Neptunitalea chrysea]
MTGGSTSSYNAWYQIAASGVNDTGVNDTGVMRSWTSYGSTNDDYLITPAFNVVSGSTDAISFDAT